MRVVVTGGAGHIGKYVHQELRGRGHTVIAADVKRPEWGGPARLIDFTRLGEVYGALRGADAVLHLAAIPYSGVHPNETVFGNNVMSTFNVFEAAAALGIRRVVQASSFTTLGFSRWVKPFSPARVPIDETHPNAPQEAYGLSKLVGEEIARQYALAHEMRTVNLRFCPVVFPELPEGGYAPRLRRYWARPEEGAEKLWSYVDVRDVATVCRLALEHEGSGDEAFYISAVNTHQREPTRELIERYFPDCGPIAADFAREDACESIVSSRHARDVLGFAPAHGWELHFQEDS
jgi:nucleoside-diphosphate-sugar epimerase